MHFIQEMAPMSMTGISFLYLFLPMLVAVFLLVPHRLRMAVLLGASLLFYALAQPVWLLPMASLGAVDYGAIRLMKRWDGEPNLRRLCAGVAIGINLSAAFLGAASLQVREDFRLFPLGLLIFTASAVSVLLGVYRRTLADQCRPVKLGLYFFFFPRLYAGPLVPYTDFFGESGELEPDWQDILDGLGLFIQGAFKYVVFGRSCLNLYERIQDYGPGQMSVLSTWCMVLLLALSLYYILSGFGDMAQGLGGMFGLCIPKNFYYPYQSRSITDFFQRFNMTLHNYLWRIVYGELHEAQAGKVGDILSMLIVGMLAGVWFGLRVNLMVWGIYLASFLVAEKYLYPKVFENTPVLLCRVYSLCVVLAGFTLLAGGNLSESVGYLFNLFRFGSPTFPLYDTHTLYLLTTNWLVLLSACFFATSGVSLAANAFQRAAPKAASVFAGIFNMGILLLLTALIL